MSQNLPIAPEVYIAASESGDVNKELIVPNVVETFLCTCHWEGEEWEALPVTTTRDDEAILLNTYQLMIILMNRYSGHLMMI